jgi:hypothetical protein
LLTHEDNNGVEQPVYHTNQECRDFLLGGYKGMFGLDLCSSTSSALFLGLQKYMIKYHLFKSLLQHPVHCAKLTSYLPQPSGYEIIFDALEVVKRQVISDLLTCFPCEECSSISGEAPGEVYKVLLADLTNLAQTLNLVHYYIKR